MEELVNKLRRLSALRRKPYPDHVQDWLEGKIDFEEFRRRNREDMERRGYFRASGSWWPRWLLDEGAVEVVNGNLHVIYRWETVPDKKDPKKTSRQLLPHPAWRKFEREEEAEARYSAYADHVTEWVEEVF